MHYIREFLLSGMCPLLCEAEAKAKKNDPENAELACINRNSYCVVFELLSVLSLACKWQI
jgi:hypothetical protein